MQNLQDLENKRQIPACGDGKHAQNHRKGAEFLVIIIVCSTEFEELSQILLKKQMTQNVT